MALGKIIATYPVVAGNGGKYMATNIAYAFWMNNNNAKIALVDFDFKNPYLGATFTSHDGVHGIDNLLERIDSRLLTDQLFMDNMIKTEMFDVLKGTKLIGQPNFITQQHISSIITMLKKHYDYILISVSPKLETSGTVYGLSYADEIVMVVRENVANYDNIKEAMTLIKTVKRSVSPVQVIFNMKTEKSLVDVNPIIYDENEDVNSKIKFEVLATFPFNADTVDNANITSGVGSKMLNKLSLPYNKSLKKSMSKLIDSISASE